MNNILHKFQGTNTMIAIYSDKNDCSIFSVGYVVALTNEHILMEHYNDRGEYDGFSIKN